MTRGDHHDSWFTPVLGIQNNGLGSGLHGPHHGCGLHHWREAIRGPSSAFLLSIVDLHEPSPPLVESTTGTKGSREGSPGANSWDFSWKHLLNHVFRFSNF